MGIGDFFSSMTDRVMRRVVETPMRNRFLRARGIGVVSIYDEDPVFARYKNVINAIIASGRLEDFVAANDAAFSEGVMLSNGFPAHALQRDYFWECLFDNPQNEHGCLPLWEAAYQRQPGPAAAALLAYTLRQISWRFRGYSFGGPDDPEDETQWGAYEEQTWVAMNRHTADGPSCRTWRRLLNSLSTGSDVSREQLDRRFEAAWADDRRDLAPLFAHANHLLPRWYGNDAQDVEVLARRSADATEAFFGLGAYALVYGSLTDLGDYDLEDTNIDPALLRDSFDDLIARFPSQSNINRRLKMLVWMDEDMYFEEALQIAKRDLKAIVPEVWDGDTRAEKLEDAEDALSIIILADDD
jgi:hypothetical protein